MLGALELQPRVRVESRPRDFAAEVRRAAVARVFIRARTPHCAHPRCGVVGRRADKAVEPIAPLAEVAHDEADDRAERAQPQQHRAVVATLRAAELRVD